MDYLFEPAPNDEAIAFIASKVPLRRAQFDRLLPELRSLAFTISGVHAADAVQDIRDMVAMLPAGERFEDLQKSIARKLLMHQSKSSDPEDSEEKRKQQALVKARFLLRHHGNQAYAVTAYNEMEEFGDIMPYWKYLTVGDDGVRDTHRALNGLILPKSHEFWRTHFPPWEFGCRCQVVPVTKAEYERYVAKDKGKPAVDRVTLTDAELERLTNERKLVRKIAGVPVDVDLRAPAERHDDDDPYIFHPNQLQIPLQSLKARYDEATWKAFEGWAKATATGEGAGSVWDWLEKATGGNAPGRVPSPGPDIMPPRPAPTVPAPVHTVPAPTLVPPVAPVAMPVRTLPTAKARTVAEQMAALGINDTDPVTSTQAANLIKALKEANPVKARDVMTFHGGKTFAALHLEAYAQEYLAMLPPHVVNQLPKIKMSMVQKGDFVGVYLRDTKEVRLNEKHFRTPSALRKTVFHELTHWAHTEGPAEYRQLIKDLFARRTAGERIGRLKGYKAKGKEDDWADFTGDTYAGAIYPRENADSANGYEVPTRHLEKLAGDPLTLSQHLNHRSKKTGKLAWRESFVTTLELFYQQP